MQVRDLSQDGADFADLVNKKPANQRTPAKELCAMLDEHPRRQLHFRDKPMGETGMEQLTALVESLHRLEPGLLVVGVDRLQRADKFTSRIALFVEVVRIN